MTDEPQAEIPATTPDTSDAPKKRRGRGPNGFTDVPVAPVDGKWLLRWRLSCGWTQTTAALQLGMAPQTYWRYEKCRAPVPLATYRAARLLHLATPNGQRALEKRFPDIPKPVLKWLKGFALS